MIDRTNPWTLLEKQVGFDCDYYTARSDKVLHRHGQTHPYVSVRLKLRGIAVLPIDPRGFTTIIGQFRYVLNRYTWECVRGGIPMDTDPLDGAKSELLEETGYRADHWLRLFDLTASPGLTDEIAPCFVAWGLHGGQPQPERDERLMQRQLPFSEAVNMCLNGEISDAASNALILGLYAKSRRKDLPLALDELLS